MRERKLAVVFRNFIKFIFRF